MALLELVAPRGTVLHPILFLWIDREQLILTHTYIFQLSSIRLTNRWFLDRLKIQANWNTPILAVTSLALWHSRVRKPGLFSYSEYYLSIDPCTGYIRLVLSSYGFLYNMTLVIVLYCHIKLYFLVYRSSQFYLLLLLLTWHFSCVTKMCLY